MRILLLFLWFPLSLWCQPPENRYTSDLFSTVNEVNDIQFSTGVPQPVPGGGFYEFITGYPLNVDESEFTYENLQMDIFQPAGDTLSKRPLVIICFGGGFLAGSRTHWSIRLLCQNLAKRGFVTAAIDYRLGMNIFDADISQRAVYRAIQDCRSAVRFFRADAAGANLYKVDPDKIFVGGHSAGALAALHNLYLDQESERPLATGQWLQDGTVIPDQECLDCVGDNQSYDGHANGCFSLAGGIGFLDYLEDSDDPKNVLFHSSDDGTVDINSGEPFGDILWLVVGSDLPILHGSNPISQRCTDIDLSHDYHSYTNRGHGVHEDGSSNLYSDIIPKISTWFYEREIKSESHLIGDTIVCDSDLEQEYILIDTLSYYYDWQISGGSFLDLDNYSNSVSVLWDMTAMDHSISVIPYNCYDARGDSLILNIDIGTKAINQNTSVSNIWNNPASWSQNHIPNACEDVVIENNSMPITLDITTHINNLKVMDTGNLTINESGLLLIKDKSSQNPNNAFIIKGTLINNGEIQISQKSEDIEVYIDEFGILKNQNGGILHIMPYYYPQN